MLDTLDLTDTERDLQRELRSWIAGNAPDELRGTSYDEVRLHGTPDQQEALAGWTDAAATAGYVCSGWPVEYGGRGLSVREIAVLTVEFAVAQLPRPTRAAGESLVGPAVITHGSDEQKRRLLPPIVSGEHVYCQGFSEPDAGSDLAGLRTRGVVDGDELVISGQKIWTSGAHRANHIFVLCRTDPDAPKHRGISYVIVPMSDPSGGTNGIEIRPITQITGASRFSETFLDGARAPLDNVIGGLHEGWRTAMTTLGNERAGKAATHYLDARREWEHLVEELRRRDALDAIARDRLSGLFIRMELMRLRTLRSLDLGADQAASTLATLHKLAWSEYVQDSSSTAVDLLGPATVAPGSADGSDGHWGGELLHNRCHTIWGGTSEVQRNIIAERVLGLPKS
jgi:alkylation response protein AidB-like acyl-CoA dehydrogenase